MGSKLTLLTHTPVSDYLRSILSVRALPMSNIDDLKLGASGFQVRNRRLILFPGELFLGKPFGALDQDYAPTYAHDLDNFFMVYGIQSAFPTLTKVMRWLGPKKIRHWLYTCERMYKVYQSLSGKLSTRLVKRSLTRSLFSMAKMRCLSTKTGTEQMVSTVTAIRIFSRN